MIIENLPDIAPVLPYVISWKFPDVPVSYAGYADTSTFGFNTLLRAIKLNYQLLDVTEKEAFETLFLSNMPGFLRLNLPNGRNYVLAKPREFELIEFRTQVDYIDVIRYNLAFQTRIIS